MELLEQYMQFRQEAEKDNKKTKKEKDPLKSKQPMTAFFLYSNERRPTLLAENKNVLKIAKILGEEWKNMSEKKRKPYEKLANKNKEQYVLKWSFTSRRKKKKLPTSKRRKSL